MKTLTAKDAKYGFGRLIDLARAEPVAVAKHGRPVVVVMVVEEFERLKALEHISKAPNARRNWLPTTSMRMSGSRR
jgi:prevent-host-death family protein